MKNNEIKNIVIGLLQDGKSTDIKAHGISMYPLFHPGDKLLVKKFNSYKKGDVIIFDRGDAFVAHRIIKIHKENIISKGDSLVKADPPVLKNEILGKVIARTRNDKITNNRNWKFKFLAGIMPIFHPILAYPFSILARSHQKFL